jgi:hypothetical protein
VSAGEPTASSGITAGRVLRAVLVALLTLGTLAWAPAASADQLANVSGLVTNSAGEPLDHIAVRAYQVDPATGDWFSIDAAFTTTDSAGAFSLSVSAGLPTVVYFFDPYDGQTSRYTSRSFVYRAQYWNGGDDRETAPQVTPTADGPVTVSQVLTEAGGRLLVDLPLIVGEPRLGSTVGCDPGEFGPDGVQLAYRWLGAIRTTDGSAAVQVEVGTGPTHVVGAAEQDRVLTCEVTASRPGYVTFTGVSFSYPVGVPSGLSLTAAPHFTASPVVGGTLTVDTGLAPGQLTPSGRPVWMALDWYVAGRLTVPGSTKTSQPVPAAWLGETVCVRATYFGDDGAVFSYATPDSAPVGLGQLVAPVPTITGTRVVGSQLTAVPGAWSPSGATLTYQWLRAGAAISGATRSTYFLVAADQGKAISVQVTGTLAGYASKTVVSGTTALILGDLTSATPTISGTRKVGNTLTAAPGAWQPVPVTFTYQWLRNGVAISGATAKSYKLVGADQGKKVSVRVTGSKPGYRTESATSSGVSIA